MSEQNGHRYKKRLFKITFGEGHEFAGLEVHMRPAPLETLLGMSAALDPLKDMGDGALAGTAAMTGEQAAGFRDLVGRLAPLIAWWNVDDDDDVPVAPDAAGLAAQEPMLVLALVEAWVGRQARVAPPLPPSSDGGGSFPEASIPMETLSPSPAS